MFPNGWQLGADAFTQGMYLLRKNMQCPCCGYYTIDTDFDFCPVCFWQDDRVQSSQPNVDCGANVPSLIEARINFKNNGVSEEGYEKYCREPLAKEEHGLEYPFAKYYYDDRLQALYRCCKESELRLIADKYGTPFNSPRAYPKNKYELITQRINAGTEVSDKWRKILEESERDYVSHWCAGYAANEKLKAPNPEFLECHKKPRRIDGTVRKLSFAEYVKKLATRDFKDIILCLDDELLTEFEEACGYSVFDVLEMDDSDCSAVCKKLFEYDENDARYSKMLREFRSGWAELRWDVPEWMANWG